MLFPKRRCSLVSCIYCCRRRRKPIVRFALHFPPHIWASKPLGPSGPPIPLFSLFGALVINKTSFPFIHKYICVCFCRSIPPILHHRLCELDDSLDNAEVEFRGEGVEKLDMAGLFRVFEIFSHNTNAHLTGLQVRHKHKKKTILDIGGKIR